MRDRMVPDWEKAPPSSDRDRSPSLICDRPSGLSPARQGAMYLSAILKDLTPKQRNAVVASYLGWTLDAFDLFIPIFVLRDVIKEFNGDLSVVSLTVT